MLLRKSRKKFRTFANETERREDGIEVQTASVTKEKETCILDSMTKYGRINSMRELLSAGKEDALEKEMQQYRFLEMAAEELFTIQ